MLEAPVADAQEVLLTRFESGERLFKPPANMINYFVRIIFLKLFCLERLEPNPLSACVFGEHFRINDAIDQPFYIAMELSIKLCS